MVQTINVAKSSESMVEIIILLDGSDNEPLSLGKLARFLRATVTVCQRELASHSGAALVAHDAVSPLCRTLDVHPCSLSPQVSHLAAFGYL